HEGFYDCAVRSDAALLSTQTYCLLDVVMRDVEDFLLHVETQHLLHEVDEQGNVADH
ncbi:unnamed protein product, partial [Amoebophrya sp. A25]